MASPKTRKKPPLNYVDNREVARRRHREFGLYVTLYCWSRGLEATAIHKSTLCRFLGLERFEHSTRVPWIEEDLGFLFPEPPRYIADVLFLSRVPLQGLDLVRLDPRRVLSLTDLLAFLPSSVRVGELPIWPVPEVMPGLSEIELGAFTPLLMPRNQTERLLAAYLALVATGEIDVGEVPGLSKTLSPWSQSPDADAIDDEDLPSLSNAEFSILSNCLVGRKTMDYPMRRPMRALVGHGDREGMDTAAVEATVESLLRKGMIRKVPGLKLGQFEPTERGRCAARERRRR